MKPDEISAMVRGILAAEFSQYGEADHVFAMKTEFCRYVIGYSSSSSWIEAEEGNAFMFSLEWSSNMEVMYLNSIAIPTAFRGRWIGYELYQIVEKIARNLKCGKIIQTPSGWCGGPEGGTRADYVVRRLGYKLTEDNVLAVKDLSAGG